MAKTHKGYRLSKEALNVISQHQRRLALASETESLEDIIIRFGKSQQSRIQRLLQKEPELKRVLLSDFISTPISAAVQPQ